MKRMRMVVLVIVLVLTPMAVFAGVIGETDQEVRSVAEPVLENILLGFENNDYTAYAKDFDITLKEAVPERKFLQTDQWYDKTLGPLVEKKYLGFLNQGPMTVILWKGEFELNENDVLIKLVMSKRGEEVVVTGLWFQ